MLPYTEAGAIAAEFIHERVSQVEEKGYTLVQDVAHYGESFDLAKAAAAYVISASAAKHAAATNCPGIRFTDWLWPWRFECFKPRTPREDLVRAGALIIAQIQVIDAMAADRQAFVDLKEGR